MTKDELKAKYARISTDFGQIEMFKNDLIDGKVIGPMTVVVRFNTVDGFSDHYTLDEYAAEYGIDLRDLYKFTLSTKDIFVTPKPNMLILYEDSSVYQTSDVLSSGIRYLYKTTMQQYVSGTTDGYTEFYDDRGYAIYFKIPKDKEFKLENLDVYFVDR